MNYPSGGMFSRARLLQLLDAVQGKLVLVYGDLVADRFIHGVPKRISREAPVLILRQEREEIRLGGGGNAIHNIVTLGGVAIPIGAVGEDPEGAALLSRLGENGVDCSAILRLARYRTPTKTRVLGGMPHAARQQIVRYDLEDELVLNEEEKRELAAILRHQLPLVDAVVISDYGYGTVTPGLVANLTDASHGRPVTLDSRRALLDYPGVTAATPNEEEAAAAAGIALFGRDEERRLPEVGRSLREALDAEALLITRGSRGMMLFERGGSELHVPVWGNDQVADVTGAGDTVIAAFTLALAAGASFAEAAKLANYAGGIVVMKMGTATASAPELREAIERDPDLGE
ncbi:MAG TPA: PfkB family carbohydrate kinase [Thermoanaerobaculia bacterium]|nr:PfkB family carbohydrate kinase [Thermoanaerobaculia bacterium]